jgi:hypothetical protein
VIITASTLDYANYNFFIKSVADIIPATRVNEDVSANFVNVYYTVLKDVNASSK